MPQLLFFFRIFELACGVLPEGGVNGGFSPLGYTFETGGFYVPRLVTALQRKGIRVEVSPTGLLVVPVAGQPHAWQARPSGRSSVWRI